MYSELKVWIDNNEFEYRKTLWVRGYGKDGKYNISPKDGKLQMEKIEGCGIVENLTPFLSLPSDFFDDFMTILINEHKHRYAVKEEESKKDGKIEELNNHNDTLKDIVNKFFEVIKK